MKKILIANYRYFVSSGPERYLFNITHALELLGHQVIPFSINYAKNAKTPYKKHFVRPLSDTGEVYFGEHRSSIRAVPRTLSRLFYSKEVENAVVQLGMESRPDIAYVLCYLRKLSPSILVGLKRLGIPVVVRLSDYGMFCPEHHCTRDEKPCTLCQRGNLLHSVRYGCVQGSVVVSALDAIATYYHRWRRYFDLIDAFVTTNPFMHRMMIEAGYDPQRLLCIPTFVDTERFSPPDRVPSPPYLLMVSRLDPPKGAHVLIDALGKLQTAGRHPPVLKIAGTGHDTDYVSRLKAQIDRVDLKERIEFLGHIDPNDIARLMGGAECTVVPSICFENLPNTLIESLACGTPVITSNIGSLASAIEDGRNGLLFRPGDSSDLASKIDAVISKPGLRNRLSQSARQTVLRDYAPDVHVDALMRLFENIGDRS